MEINPADDLDSVPRWYFAVGGLETTQARLPLNTAIELRRLTSYPGQEALASCLQCLTTAGLMAHHGEAVIQHELVFDATRFDDFDLVVWTARLVMAALRIRTAAEVCCPAFCERSWADLAGDGAERIRAYRLEQVTLAHKFGTAYRVTPDDLAWVGQSLGPMAQLMDDDRFATAADALAWVNSGVARDSNQSVRSFFRANELTARATP